MRLIPYKDNTIEIYASRVVDVYTYKDKSLCFADDKDIVEAYYTYTLKNGKFTKKRTKTITAKEYISNKDITCS